MYTVYSEMKGYYAETSEYRKYYTAVLFLKQKRREAANFKQIIYSEIREWNAGTYFAFLSCSAW